VDLNPQGDDVNRALVTFANGKPITTDEQGSWLAIHGANCYGIDKVSFVERVRWVERNERMILASAADPLENLDWSKADEPWQFLAFCFEWAAFQREGFGFASSLPVRMDGTCNGLQHFSALLRDEKGGAAVNLIASEAPQDIYQHVADRVVEILSGKNDAMAKEWLGIEITRDLVKKSAEVQYEMHYGGDLIRMHLGSIARQPRPS
jgi:Autographiviridae RNA polymerase